MEYRKIISVTGLGGLYELISSKADGAIVRSLDDKSTKFISSRVHNFSQLESIEIFTTHENVNLVDVLKAMQQSSESLPAEKDAAAVKKYFEKVFPSMDFERVYASDMKKMVRWFSILQKNNIEFRLSSEEEAAGDVETVDKVEAVEPAETVNKVEAVEEVKEEAAPKKKAARKKTKKEEE